MWEKMKKYNCHPTHKVAAATVVAQVQHPFLPKLTTNQKEWHLQEHHHLHRSLHLQHHPIQHHHQPKQQLHHP